MDTSFSFSIDQSPSPAMASISVGGSVDSRFLATKKISLLLDDDNYLLWRQQVLLTVKMYKLQRFLNPQTIPPPQQIVTNAVLGNTGQRLVCKLKKSLYGLRQAPRAWFCTLKQFLVEHLGFRVSKADSSLFIRGSSTNTLILMAYVDDIILTGDSNKDIDDVVVQLNRKFSLKDMGTLSFFLGKAVIPSSSGLILSQKKYITDILSKTGMLGAASTPTPMVVSPKVTESRYAPPLFDAQLYRRIIGMLQYTCITRPDLSFSVNKFSQYMNQPIKVHWKAVKRVLRYLIGTIDHGLHLSQGDCSIVGYSDADWASSVEDRRSTTGFSMKSEYHYL
ncbi:hypothetical protein EPI10_022618 [Gossypium australe]|uniref:Reverse transcriptase Ty1/copia-type domain-containing protein n=1 Tax=Gossypium australe TaxID=47621 RepID=A0A5B6VRS4_9ROSI|nr:hypothetical protein EPI10_022618 [Gossypium australe]